MKPKNIHASLKVLATSNKPCHHTEQKQSSPKPSQVFSTQPFEVKEEKHMEITTHDFSYIKIEEKERKRNRSIDT